MHSAIRSIFPLLLILNIVLAQSSESPAYSFAWFSDTHIGSSSAANDLAGVVRDVNNNDSISFVIISGDITETDTGDNLWQAKQILDSLSVPYHIIPGNHDTKWSSSGATRFSHLWGDDRFNVEVGEYRFIGVHQGPILRMGAGYIDPDDINWVKSILTTLPNLRQKIFIVMHYPLNQEIDNWHVFRDLLQPYNIQAVLHGHHHSNKTWSFEGIPGIGSRSTLSRGKQPCGYTLVKLYTEKADFFERIPQADSLRLWHSLALGERDFTDSSRIYPDFSANETSGVSLVWRRATGAILTSSPVAYDNKVLISSTDGSLRALNQGTGEEIWKWQGTGAIHSTPAVKGERIVIGASDSSISCLSSVDGSLKWTTKISGPILSSALIHKNRVFIGSGTGSFYSLNVRNGKIKWTYPDIEGFIETRPILAENKVLFGAWDGSFYALNARNGRLAWKWSDGRSGQLYSPAACWPVAAHGKVFIVAPDRAITAIDLDDGNTVWRNTDHKVREMIGISENGESVYARTMQDTAFAVTSAADSFKLQWKVDAGYGYDFAPSMMIEKDGHVFFGTKDGWIYCLESSNGNVIWKYRVSDGLVNTVYPLDANNVLTTGTDGIVSLLRYQN